MGDHGIRFILAAQSLALMLAAASWWLVWKRPTYSRVRRAALTTALCAFLAAFVIALAIATAPR